MQTRNANRALSRACDEGYRSVDTRPSRFLCVSRVYVYVGVLSRRRSMMTINRVSLNTEPAGRHQVGAFEDSRLLIIAVDDRRARRAPFNYNPIDTGRARGRA